MKGQQFGVPLDDRYEFGLVEYMVRVPNPNHLVLQCERVLQRWLLCRTKHLTWGGIISLVSTHFVGRRGPFLG